MKVDGGSKPKKQSLRERLFGSRKDRRVSRSKTIVKIKTVGEIPPITETRKALGDGNTKLAVVNAFKYAKDDFMRFFGISTTKAETNRQFLIRCLGDLGIKVPEIGYIDNYAIMDSMNEFVLHDDQKAERLNALKKLTSFYLEYYERTKYGDDWSPDPETII
ncbi:hypothetical protein B1B_14862, partial [mine drainage metagenome]